jgi:hypothetical protein
MTHFDSESVSGFVIAGWKARIILLALDHSVALERA